MNRIVKQIEKIKQINSNGNLVIFVGAGVSKNSGICSWWELVKEIADKIGENKCSSCEIKDLVCGECGEQIKLCGTAESDCKLKYNFSAEDFLRIPQHFYESFDENDKISYFDFLKEKFCSVKYETNIIDEIIVKLQPDYIITTNYDHLLENVKDPRVSKYAVIKKDDDILSKKGRNYIIKMHGDIDDIENIVLKEDDYLNYSQKHIMIEIFIKSLLIDKTFVFVGYSLNDNNLKLIMSYIDFFVKEKRIKNRQPHYLVVDKIKDGEHDIPYWENKGVELVDLSQISDYMIENSKCTSISNDVGKKLYTFLYYLNKEGLSYTNDKIQELNGRLIKFTQDNSCFNYISYKTILEIFNFKSLYGIKTPVLIFSDKEEYDNLKILLGNKELRNLLIKAGINGIQLESRTNRDNVHFEEESKESDSLFELSINNKYHEIMEKIEKESSSSIKAYYYFLIKDTEELSPIMNDLKEEYEFLDYQDLSNHKCYNLAIYEFNKTCMRSLSYLSNEKDDIDKLNLLLQQAAARYSSAYNTIKDIVNKKAEILEMNDILLKHEEYYMKKASMSKMGGTIYGELFQIRQIAYDYYLFYKKNHLMLDWFVNVKRMVMPYIKAIFCTYYPDEFQGDFRGGFMRTRVSAYPIELLDVDMMVKHIKQKELKSIASHYKVESIELSDKFDISLLFENFCLSMKEYWNLRMIDQLESFSYLLSLCKLSYEQNVRIVRAFLLLLTPAENENICAITNNIYALLIYVERHFDESIKEYSDLLELLINSDILLEERSHNVYSELMKIFSELADKNIYKNCCKEFDNIKNNNRQKTLWVFIHRRVLLKYDESKWKNFIEENLNENWEQEIFQLLYEEILPFNDKIKEYYVSKLNKYASSNKGIHSYPDYKAEAINHLVLYILLGIVNKDDIEFMRAYSNMSDYLKFIFNPESFDYRNIKISDFIWCNFLNNNHYRERILEHKSEFWNKEEEKRIELGFGSSFENRVAYKYLFN